jgi:Protein O-mannosyl-transferase TMEM260-like
MRMSHLSLPSVTPGETEVAVLPRIGYQTATETASRYIAFAGAIAGGLAFLVYVRTLAPGLIAINDTPKFQFIGRILGTAHNPGYPLYVVVSHFFGYLPIGSLAWRINLMSALFGALTIALFVLVAGATHCRPLAAAAAGLGMAFGSAFWGSATIAEVYTLHTFLVFSMTYALLRWRDSQRQGWFFAAIGCFALGLGHHTDIVMLAPAVALFGLLVAPRFVLRPRTIGLVLVLITLGFAQYLFVLVRSIQGVWGESYSNDFRGLVDNVRGVQSSFLIEPFAWDTVRRRLPLIAGAMISEVSPAACVLASIGCVVLAMRDRALLVLALAASAGIFTFGVFYRAPDVSVFLLPACLFTWLLAAHGAESVAALVGRRRVWVHAAGVLPLLVAAWLFGRNLEARDLSHDRHAMRYFDALLRQIPDRSALLSEDFLVDRMVLYETFGEELTRGRDVRVTENVSEQHVTALARQGYNVFGFMKATSELRRDGLDFDYAPWPLVYGSLRQFLDDQPAGSIVAMAVPASRFGAMLQRGALPLDAMGGTVPTPAWSNLTAVGVIRRAGGINQSQTSPTNPASAFAARARPIGGTVVLSPADILAEATYDRVAIRIGAREIIASSDAPVVTVWNPHGDFERAFALTPDGQVPMDAGDASVYRLRAVGRWTSIGPAPSDVSEIAASGHVMIKGGAAPLVVYAGRNEPLAPRVLDATPWNAALSVKELAGGTAALRESVRKDGWPSEARLDTLRYVYRIEVGVASQPTHVGLGGLPDLVLAAAPDRGSLPSIHRIDLNGQLERIGPTTDRLHMARDHHDFFLGRGWRPVAVDETGAFRVVDTEAELMIPCGTGACATADFQLSSESAGLVGLSVNAIELDPQPLHPNWHRYRWSIPDSTLRPGMNSFVLKPSRVTLVGDVLLESKSAH